MYPTSCRVSFLGFFASAAVSGGYSRVASAHFIAGALLEDMSMVQRTLGFTGSMVHRGHQTLQGSIAAPVSYVYLTSTLKF